MQFQALPFKNRVTLARRFDSAFTTPETTPILEATWSFRGFGVVVLFLSQQLL